MPPERNYGPVDGQTERLGLIALNLAIPSHYLLLKTPHQSPLIGGNLNNGPTIIGPKAFQQERLITSRLHEYEKQDGVEK